MQTVSTSLHGPWTIASSDGAISAVYAVPGDVHTALHAAGVIPHPYEKRNEYDVRWVAEQEWTARRTFIHRKDEAPWVLDIDYLDTVAEVSINGAVVLRAQNCFRRYTPDVTAHLRDGENEISIVFRSNVREAKALQKAQPFHVPYASQNCPIPDGNMLRKPACHFGWDWNLAIAPFGLYGRCTLRRIAGAQVVISKISQHHHSDGSVDVDVAYVVSNATGPVQVYLDLCGQHIEQNRGNGATTAQFRIAKPVLWWPAGQGEQVLHGFSIHCAGVTQSRRIGLRKIELLTTSDTDGKGSRFALSVNGREIFCKGANWIPADALPSRATESATRRLLQAAVDADMNMVRVWGGGYYEQDFFYDLCDELGLLVWQDFMFACNLYPSTPDFLHEVQQEVTYQVQRLQHHACLALWCGDNELIGALTWFEESRNNRDRYLVSYDRLNRTIEQALRDVDGAALWWPSSPSSGMLNFGDAWHDDSSGDMHFWSVWHEGKNFEHYRDVKPRFCSEFGFQSFPSLNVVKAFAAEEDLNIASPVMESHQKNAGGNARIAETMFRYFRFPEGFGSFVYLSQVQQGLAMRTAVEYWRSLKPHCMGALYWQLNDTWPCASWSGLDHGGGWKLLHYMARRFFAPVLVSAVPQPDGEIKFFAVNDLPGDVELILEVEAVTSEGKRRLVFAGTAIVPVTQAIEVGSVSVASLVEENLLFLSWSSSDGQTGRNHFALAPYKAMPLCDCGLVHSIELDNEAAHIDISAEQLALFVALEAEMPGHFSDNAFDMLPGEKRRITFTPAQRSELSRFPDQLVIRDLYSSSH